MILYPLVLISIFPSSTVFPASYHDPRFDRPDSRILASRSGISKITISVTAITAQLITSSVIPISRDQVRGVLKVVCECVPWFCRIIEIGGGNGECGSSLSYPEGIGGDMNMRGRGKENGIGGAGRGKGIEGLLIFGKREGRLIGREEVLCQFRMKKEEYERQAKV
jgi:hypothetical protein